MQQLLVVLQKSAWYQDLNSSTKIAVNQQLALLSAELKKFNTDPSLDKVFDLTYVTANPTLQHILTSLGVYMDENGYFCQVEDSPKENPSLPSLASLMSTPPPGIVPSNLDLNILSSLAPILSAPPPRIPVNNVRPSILGLPPPMLPLNENLLKFLPNANAFAQSMFGNMGRNDRDDRGGGGGGGGGGSSNQRRDQDRRGNWNSSNRNNRRNDYGNQRRKN